jgi:hypothetical protein
MPQISTQEFERLPLRVHDFLAGVPLHDVWAIDLPRTRSGITLDEFLRTASSCLLRPSPVVRALLNIRFFVGRLLGWDREPVAWESFATRMTTAVLFTTSILPKAAFAPGSRNSSAMQLTATKHGGSALASHISAPGVTTPEQWHYRDTCGSVSVERATVFMQWDRRGPRVCASGSALAFHTIVHQGAVDQSRSTKKREEERC